jgi:hypothetical protein
MDRRPVQLLARLGAIASSFTSAALEDLVRRLEASKAEKTTHSSNGQRWHINGTRGKNALSFLALVWHCRIFGGVRDE